MATISDDERREVVARLRNDARGGVLPFTDFLGAVAYDTFALKDPRAALDRLADLIEGSTCHMVSAFDTDELEDYQESVSLTPEDTLVYRCEGCGFEFRYERSVYPKYCPNCRAKVVLDGD